MLSNDRGNATPNIPVPPNGFQDLVMWTEVPLDYAHATMFHLIQIGPFHFLGSIAREPTTKHFGLLVHFIKPQYAFFPILKSEKVLSISQLCKKIKFNFNKENLRKNM